MVNVDLGKYIKESMESYKKTVAEISKDEITRVPMINREEVLYSFDDISKNLIPSAASVDAICVQNKGVVLIEFKQGFADKSCFDTYDPSKVCCPHHPDESCFEFFEISQKNRKLEKENLYYCLRQKAVETFCTLEKQIFPLCCPSEGCKLTLYIVVDLDPIEEEISVWESVMNGESARNIQQRNQAMETYNAITDALKKYKISQNNRVYFFDEVEVMGVQSFTEEKLPKLIS